MAGPGPLSLVPQNPFGGPGLLVHLPSSSDSSTMSSPLASESHQMTGATGGGIFTSGEESPGTSPRLRNWVLLASVHGPKEIGGPQACNRPQAPEPVYQMTNIPDEV